jgi:hypothetical protein
MVMRKTGEAMKGDAVKRCDEKHASECPHAKRRRTSPDAWWRYPGVLYRW